MPSARGPRTRLLLTLAALLSLIVGYYLGQFWQRRPLADLSAVVYPAGRPLADTGDLLRELPEAWRLLGVVDTRVPACTERLREYRFMRNRLAGAPSVQSRLRLTLLAYDQPDAAQRRAFTADADWIDLVSADPAALDRLSGELGILPGIGDWCSPVQSNLVLVSPRQEAWALVPYEDPATIARNVRTVIEFVE
jgi:hypothetical protein